MSSDNLLLLNYNFYALLTLRSLNKAVEDHGRSTFFFFSVCVFLLSNGKPCNGKYGTIHVAQLAIM
jgi:hypothetical protein